MSENQKVYLVGHDDGSFGHEGKALLVIGETFGKHGCLEIEKILMVLDDLDDFRPVEAAMGLIEGIHFHYYEL